jgi:transposase-like protein
MEKIPLKRYSLAFKQQIVREYEAGATASQLRQKYGITGGSTIAGWVKRFGRYGTRHTLMVIQTPNEQHRVKELEGRIQQLESALAKVTLDNFMLETIIMVADEEHSLDLKKKVAPRFSTKPSNGSSRRS